MPALNLSAIFLEELPPASWQSIRWNCALNTSVLTKFHPISGNLQWHFQLFWQHHLLPHQHKVVAYPFPHTSIICPLKLNFKVFLRPAGPKHYSPLQSHPKNPLHCLCQLRYCSNMFGSLLKILLWTNQLSSAPKATLHVESWIGFLCSSFTVVFAQGYCSKNWPQQLLMFGRVGKRWMDYNSLIQL